mmetsp:Transcript_57019/g.94337  ORF Transcript_57019/g.94337 Transcript_57019/m.94337 type:complete len:88 (+) Transcript_57019:7-270(+)
MERGMIISNIEMAHGQVSQHFVQWINNACTHAYLHPFIFRRMHLTPAPYHPSLPNTQNTYKPTCTYLHTFRFEECSLINQILGSNLH